MERLGALLKRGADVNASDSGGETALFYAVKGGRAEFVDALLKAGARANTVDASGTPLLMDALGNASIVKSLVAAGAEINAKDGNGNTALGACVILGRYDLARWLVENGASIEEAMDSLNRRREQLLRAAERLRMDSSGEIADIYNPQVVATFKNEAANDEAGVRALEELRRQAKPADGTGLAGNGSSPSAAVQSSVDRPGFREKRRPDDFALVIGISRYRDVPPAPFADRDAEAIKRYLVAMGYPEENVVVLLGDHATEASLADKLERWLPMNVDPRSTVFVYYSGHGAPDPASGKAYLVPWDGKPDNLPATAFSLTRLYRDLGKLSARRVIVALDSCFSGAGGRSVLPKGARPLVTRAAGGVPADGKTVVFTASKGNQISGTIEREGHGLFTYYFLKGLDGAAVTRRSPERVTVGSLYRYLLGRVTAAAHRQDREQTPQLLPSLTRDGAVVIR